MNGGKRELSRELGEMEEFFTARAIRHLKEALGPTVLEEARVKAATNDLLLAKLIAEVRVLTSKSRFISTARWTPAPGRGRRR